MHVLRPLSPNLCEAHERPGLLFLLNYYLPRRPGRQQRHRLAVFGCFRFTELAEIGRCRASAPPPQTHQGGLIERCALAGDQVGQGHAVGCEAGKLCELVGTVLKSGSSASWQKHRNIHMTPPWRHWSARPGAVSLLCCAGSAIARAMAF